MTFEEWWKSQTTNFDPDEIGLMQLARITWNAAQLEEREACAKVCEYLEENGWVENLEYGSCSEFSDAASAIRCRSD